MRCLGGVPPGSPTEGVRGPSSDWNPLWKLDLLTERISDQKLLTSPKGKFPERIQGGDKSTVETDNGIG